MQKILFAICLLIVSASLLAMGSDFFSSGKQPTVETGAERLAIAHKGMGPEMNGDERKILKELRELMSPAENIKQPFYMKGVIKSADSVNNTFQEDRFVFFSNGESVYCMSADQELIYDKAFFLSVNKQANSLVIAPPKVIESIAIPFKTFSTDLKEEGYKLEKLSIATNESVIRMYCDNHITCKEMKVVYNEKERRPLQISYILTDAEHFGNADFDKKVVITIDEWSTGTAALIHHFPKIISVVDGTVTLLGGYENMNVINLNNQE